MSSKLGAEQILNIPRPASMRTITCCMHPEPTTASFQPGTKCCFLRLAQHVPGGIKKYHDIETSEVLFIEHSPVFGRENVSLELLRNFIQCNDSAGNTIFVSKAIGFAEQ